MARAVVLAAAVASAACGSTVPSGQRTAVGASDIETGTSDTAVPPAEIDPAAGPNVRAAVATTRPVRTGPAVVGPGRASAGKPIEIGIGVDSNLDGFASAFGASSSQPDERTVAAAVVDDINKTGGLAGHPIAPIYTEFDSTSSDWVAQDERSCAAFVQDHHVVAAVRTDDIFGPLDACLANAGVPRVLYESAVLVPQLQEVGTLKLSVEVLVPTSPLAGAGRTTRAAVKTMCSLGDDDKDAKEAHFLRLLNVRDSGRLEPWSCASRETGVMHEATQS